ncbi:MAG TPA: hypothetical protein VJ022_11390 [Anaerolineales bacterium]|nr:hypothetical protein [Anaerolineales bacterium]
MKIPRPLAFALTGWLVGAIATVGVGLYWPTIFPAIVVVEHYYGGGPSLLTIIGFGILLASPGGLVGGLIGSRIPREGGLNEQFGMAGIMGIIFSLPFACMILWFFTGW